MCWKHNAQLTFTAKNQITRGSTCTAMSAAIRRRMNDLKSNTREEKFFLYKTTALQIGKSWGRVKPCNCCHSQSSFVVAETGQKTAAEQEKKITKKKNSTWPLVRMITSFTEGTQISH